VGRTERVALAWPRPAHSVDYYGKGKSEGELLREHYKLLDAFGSIATERGDTLLLIQSTLPIGPRFTGLMRVFLAPYRRDSTGRFRPM
jgi:hypothetical protein